MSPHIRFPRQHGCSSLSRSCFSSCSVLLLGATAAAASPSVAFPLGESPDYSIPGVQVVQAIQTGFTPLVARKSTCVRMTVLATGSVPPGTKVDGLMRVFVEGVETAFSPVYSDNGPIAPSATPTLEDENSTLNFLFLPPPSTNVLLQLELNPAGPNQVPESSFANNTASVGPLAFACRRAAELVYVPIDYRPNNEPTPNLPDAQLIEPGMGDNFVEAIYATGDWNYHRSVVPSKLWTQSVAGSGSGLLSALAVDQQLMLPKPDFIYGFIPGGLSYNGQTISIPGTAMMGNTEPIRYQRTVAHELGHCFGLFHNTTTVGFTGVDVEEHLHLTQQLPFIKTASLKDIMYAGLLTHEAWIAANNYEVFYNSATLACAADSIADAPSAPAAEMLLVAGLWTRASGSVELTDALVFTGGSPSPPVPLAEADLVLRAWARASVVAEAGVRLNASTDSCAGADSVDSALPIGSFVVVLAPTVDPDALERLEVIEQASGRVLAELEQSSAAPAIEFTAPTAGQALGTSLSVEWTGSDADGDALRYYLTYSPDGVRRIPLASNLADTHFQLDLAPLPALQSGKGWLELSASDGLRTTRVRSEGLQPGAEIQGGTGNAPWAYVLTPDNGMRYPKGGSVILHATAWDLEDLLIDGHGITWSSSQSGQLGFGRLLSVASLSLGVHVISMQAEDAAGNITTDTTTIQITDRLLPGPGPMVCQSDLGFGGPGSSLLTLCGGDLASGSSAELKLANAAANKAAWLAVGATSTPTAFLGGTVVPIPFTVLLSGATDAGGVWSFPNVPGGGGPFTLYCQAVYVDLGQSEGVGISNALKADFLP